VGLLFDAAADFDGIPADMDFTFGSDDLQLPQAFIQIEPGINGRQ
jgi:hypothetical protein